MHNALTRRKLRRCYTRIGDRVALQLSAVFLASPEDALARLTLDSEVEGTILEFSDSGVVTQAFAVVNVLRSVTVVVPTNQLRLVEEERT